MTKDILFLKDILFVFCLIFFFYTDESHVTHFDMQIMMIQENVLRGI